ncbi:PKD domain-containing protein [Dokdonella fugitiva]|uniref:PKD domain-containing protein n=1 Tax=Dokdonella fugitiva TaxID=328517 RepID=A0A4V2S2N5_9GAMM|nr:PKD domain-containing protein [Dokdonella fugitiva]TCO41150.1 PKD domain-containing protein [Dokdonella fugitiva]
MHHPTVPRLLRLALSLAGLCALAAGAAPLPRFATHEYTPLDCDQTPFGRHVTLGGEAEYIDFVAAGSGFSNIDEYQPAGPSGDPLARTFRNALLPGALAGSTFLKAISVDFDGDGRDEVVTANRSSGGALVLGVFERGTGPAATLIDTWTMAQPFNIVDLAAGDFDGSTDQKQELAVLVRTSTFGLRLFVLTGAADGSIAQADGQAAGEWVRTDPVGQVSLAAGDMLLDGRTQAVVVNEKSFGASRTLNYHLLEYLPGTPQLPVGAGDTAIGSKTFTSAIGMTYEAENGTPGIDNVIKIEADAGDVVDSAAAELVVLTQFEQSGSNYIGARLHHFTTTRDAGNAITGIGFAGRGAGQEYDSSRIVQGQNESGIASFEATVADVDRVSPGEIVLARADAGSRLQVDVYKAAVDLAAGYTWVESGMTVRFTDTSTGAITQRDWNFGDGTGVIHDRSPTHIYTQAGSYNVVLKIYDGGATRTYSQTIAVGTGGSGSGGTSPGYMYHLRDTPTYAAGYPVDSLQSLAFVNVAVGDMDKDGIPEVMTIARNTTDYLLRSVWRLADTSVPASFSGRHFSESSPAFPSMTALDLVASDFDGDSVQATLGTDCRQVEEPQLRQVVWLPPYFKRLQDGADKLATFGKSTSGGSSYEKQSGSFTSHDVSAYIGIGVGSDVAGVKASVHATAGYNYQSSHGAIHGTENTYTINQGYAQDDGEALAVVEENSFNCYSYQVESAAGGVDGDSAVRMCEVIDGSRYMSASDAQSWDREIPAASPGHPPAQWMPLHRDWNSLALFRPVTSNASFTTGNGADKATDGLFSSATEAGPGTQPYLQVDLGEVRDISDIRVFPARGEEASLKGFRVYASINPMNGAGVPGGGGVRAFAPETADDVGFDRWNIWTRDAANPANMLRARYIRLQNPGTASLRVAEIQVFGDVHAEPPAYPEAVCDPIADDGLFNAYVWDSTHATFKTIEVRGDMLWNGTGEMDDCTNHSGLLQADIWPGTVVGASGTLTWDLSQDANTLVGSNTSFESSTRVGAEFDLEAGFIATVQAGGAYEYTTGITEEVQTTSFWGTGLEIGGEISGFAPAYSGLVNSCRYNPRPYAYHLVDLSNTGYRHDIYAVDYTVHQGPGLWQRGSVPVLCLHDDPIFGNGFD